MPDHEATAIEAQNLHVLAALGEKDPKVTAKGIAARGTHEAAETIEATTDVHGLGVQEYPYRRWQPDHAPPS